MLWYTLAINPKKLDSQLLWLSKKKRTKTGPKNPPRSPPQWPLPKTQRLGLCPGDSSWPKSIPRSPRWDPVLFRVHISPGAHGAGVFVHLWHYRCIKKNTVIAIYSMYGLLTYMIFFCIKSNSHMRTMVLEYWPTFALVQNHPVFCRFLYTSTMLDIL